MGYTDELDVIATLAALEMILADLGLDVEPGWAVTAAQQVLIGQGSAARNGSSGSHRKSGLSIEGVLRSWRIAFW